ncbi:unnamed protein product [Angiostrongylus costaricensis]|uniref:Ragulator complex protein LAMTOR1 n=1 Tax=Angiostrongylus costaricensis TaxID=334426 RepID=A0A0R3PRT2_ANGCS|nr:unnamed protein product [Angiostrongylus costaricensis]
MDCYACISVQPVESHRMQAVTIKMDDICCRIPDYAAADPFINKTRSLSTSQEPLTQVSSTDCRELISRDVETVAGNYTPNKDAVVQTDDSYLKIARRLDEYRSMRTKFLPVFAASPNRQLDNTSKFGELVLCNYSNKSLLHCLE